MEGILRILKSPEAMTAIIIAALSLILSAYTSYDRNDKALGERIAILETHRTDDAERLNRIEIKLDDVGIATRELLKWAGVTHDDRR